MEETGTLDFTEKEIFNLINEGNEFRKTCGMKPRYQTLLDHYIKNLLNLNL